MKDETGGDDGVRKYAEPTIPTEGRADGGGSSSGRGSHSVQQRPRQGHRQGHRYHERDSASLSMSGEDDEELDEDDDDDEDREGESEDQYSINSRRNRQWTGDSYIADGHMSTNSLGAANGMFVDGEDATRTGISTTADLATAGASSRAQSPRSARRLRNRLAAARMRTRQKQQLVELEKRKSELERRASDLQRELHDMQRKNNPLNSSIDKLTEMIDELTKVECTMLTGIDECKGLLQNLEKLYESKQQRQQPQPQLQPQPQPQQ
ncbi:hypothetical protein H4S04_001368 [Coemansia sp. S16]|nr:hypothetical protein H4S04_001368 [Coemansia sp. S16]